MINSSVFKLFVVSGLLVLVAPAARAFVLRLDYCTGCGVGCEGFFCGFFALNARPREAGYWLEIVGGGCGKNHIMHNAL
jgi:hypothetical protein